MYKKIMLLILLLLPVYVRAEIFYTNYEYTQTINERIEEDDLTKVEEIKAYNNYQTFLTGLGYHESMSGAYIKDENNFIKDFNCLKESNIYDLYTTAKITKISKIKYFMFRSFDVPNAIISSIKIYNKDQEINYSYLKTNYEIGEYINEETEFIISLNEYYDIENLKITIVFHDESLKRIAFMVNVYEEYSYPSKNYSYFSNDIPRKNTDEIYNINFNQENTFKTILEKASWINKKNYDSTSELTYYKEPVIKYYYYVRQRKSLNEYTEEPLENCELKYSDNKTLYKIYKREIIEISDELNENLIIKANNIDDIKLTLTDEETSYLLKIEYKENTFYKEYIKKETIIKDKKEESSNQVIADIIETQNEAFESNIIENPKTLDNKNNYYIYTSISLLLVTLLYKHLHKNK